MDSDVKLRYKMPFLLLFVFAILGIFMPGDTNLINSSNNYNYGDIAWLLTASGLVMLMTPGVGFFYGGMVSHKNIVSTILQSFVALGLVTCLWIFVGFSIAFGDSIFGIIGNPMTFFMFRDVGVGINKDFASTIPFILWALFQMKFAILTPALIIGGLAERVRFTSLLVFICLFSIFVYAPLAHWTWHPDGFLRQWGVLDFAGGAVVHISSGVAALAGAIFLGKRKNENSNPANIPYVILGTGLLWFGWIGFNGGSSLSANDVASVAVVNTSAASGVAMIAWMFLDSIRGKKRSAVGFCVGAVVGLVAITPAAGFVNIGQSVFIGFIASVICNLSVTMFYKSEIDDTLDVFACHGVGGIVGMILTGIFAKDVGLFYGQTHIFLYHIIAVIIVVVFVFVASSILYRITNIIVPLRVNKDQEKIGLDITQHGERAYGLKD